ncbi:MAG: efflux transporter outer membrane subunit [Alphaproteobacteria bacterium]|nr:efflux transporter outer membrane subunit [Alphaproteobacteria bacterium]
MNRSSIAGLSFVSIILAGCSADSPYLRPIVELPSMFRELTGIGNSEPAAAIQAASPAVAQDVWPESDWWTGFGSSDLDKLVLRAQGANFDLAAAEARIRQAIAQAEIAGAPQFPDLTVSSGAQRQQSSPSSGSTTRSSNPIWSNRFNLQLATSYEIDFWGKNSAALDAAHASIVATRYAAATTALTTIANVANGYFQILGLTERLNYARQSLADAEDILAAVRAREQVGTASLLDIAPQVSIVEGQRAAIASLERQLAQQSDALGVLLGSAGRPEIAPVALTSLKIPKVGPGLPSELLRRRPDVANAEAQLISANASVRNAIAQRFPSLSLTGSGGFQSSDLSKLLDPKSQIFSLAASLTAPIFAGGRLEGQEKLQRAKFEELAATYQKSIVQAFADVETALSGAKRTREQLVAQGAATDASRLAFEAAQAQYRVGSIDSVTLRDTERSYFNALDALAQARLGYYQALVALFQSLGGGWEIPAE